MVTEYSDDFFEFYGKVMADRERYKNDRAVLDNQPMNFFDVSCLPWVKYKHFDVHVFDEGKFLAPVVTWGKYEPGKRQTDDAAYDEYPSCCCGWIPFVQIF